MRKLILVTIAVLLAGSGLLGSANAALPGTDPLAAYAASARLGTDPDGPLPWTVTPSAEPTVAPSVAEPSAVKGGAFTLDPSDPYQAFLSDLALAGDPSSAQIADAVADYFRALGFETPDLDMAEDPFFEENLTIHYTHPLSDVNGDGVDDLLLDTYCNALGVCNIFTATVNAASDPNHVNRLQYYRCGWPHRLVAASGVDGEWIWNRSLVPRMDFLGVVPYTWQFSCAFSFVVGLMPFPDGSNGILVYEYGVYRPAGFAERIISNHFLMLDPATGETVWEKTILGTMRDSLVSGAVPISHQAENVFVNPIIQAPNPSRIPVDPEGLTGTLHFQGVGYNLTFAEVIDNPQERQLGIDRAIPVLEQYDALETISRIEPATGRELWKTQSFVPTRTHSILPAILHTPPLPSCCLMAVNTYGTEPQTTAISYWNPFMCCFDVNGDKVPDLVYRTYEWYALPMANTDGPYSILSRIIAYDGVGGQLLYEHVVEEGTSEPPFNAYWQRFPHGSGLYYSVALQALGDVNADGSADYAVHLMYDELAGFKRVISIRNGPDGSELWRLESERDFAILPIGRATPDGDDFLIVDWFAVSQYLPTRYHYANVTRTPLAVFNGLDGSIVWRDETFMAPADILFMFSTARTNGVLDLNGDQVGDIALDDPLQLPDLTIIHRFTIVSGVDGDPLYRVDTAGQFGFPARVADVTGDGIADLGVLNGDITDLWLTVFDGEGGEPLWSVRVLSPRASSYTTAQPRMRIHVLSQNVTPEQDFVLNFQLNTYTVGGSFAVSPTTPAIGVYDGIKGSIFWSIPRQLPQEIGFVNGTSPATQLFYEAIVAGEDLRALGVANPQAHINLLPAAASLLAGFGAAFGIARWRLGK